MWRQTSVAVVLCVLTCFFRQNYWMGPLAAYNRDLPTYCILIQKVLPFFSPNAGRPTDLTDGVVPSVWGQRESLLWVVGEGKGGRCTVSTWNSSNWGFSVVWVQCLRHLFVMKGQNLYAWIPVELISGGFETVHLRYLDKCFTSV